MTQVLSSMDSLRNSLDNYGASPASSVADWRAKYIEAADMLAETRTELDDFVHSSKELEEELLRELERTEKTQTELKDKVLRVEADRDEWKAKFVTLQTNHNTAVNSLHRELDTLRQEHQKLKIQFRDLELGNDDLERTERAITSSLADVEAKYARVLEEKIILEQELVNKATVEEELQRLKDELRDASIEIQVLKNQADNSTSGRHTLITPPTTESSVSPAHDNPSTTELQTNISEDDQLLDTAIPEDVLYTDGTAPAAAPPLVSSRPSSTVSSPGSNKGPSIIFPRTSIGSKENITPKLRRPTAVNLASPSKLRTSSNASRPSAPVRSSASAIPTSKSKGVQMVSEMRAKVRNLEQRLHTKVPRLRSATFRDPDRDVFSTPTNQGNKTTQESPGWVLVDQESPMPMRTKSIGHAPRRSSPPPGAYRSNLTANGTDDSPTSRISGMRPVSARLPQSALPPRSSIPTPSASRPTTPTLVTPPSKVFNPKRASIPALPIGRRSLGGPTTRMSSEVPAIPTMRHASLHMRTMAPPPVPAKVLGSPLLPAAVPVLKTDPSKQNVYGSSRIGRPLSLGFKKPERRVDSNGPASDVEGRLRRGSLTEFGADGETF